MLDNSKIEYQFVVLIESTITSENAIQVSAPTVHRDIQFLRQQAQENLHKHIYETIPQDYQHSLTVIKVLKMAWSILTQDMYNKTKLQALALINDCNKYQSVVVTISLFFASNRRVDAQNDKKAFRFVVTTSSAEAKICLPVPREMNTAAITIIMFWSDTITIKIEIAADDMPMTAALSLK